MAVGDAIFSPGYDELDNRATEDVATRKAGKTNQYVRQLVLVDDKGQAHFPFERGLVIYCGAPEHVGILEEACSSQVEFLPLRPLGEAEDLIPIDQDVLSRLASFLDELRQSVR